MGAYAKLGDRMTAAAPATTTSVAQELVALCRAGRNLDAVNKLYSPKIVSIEPMGSESMPAEMTGLDAVRGKNQWWFENNEVHKAEVNGPFVGEGQFAVHYTYETTFKPSGQRVTMSEMALYTVKDGKIAKEQFYYNVPASESDESEESD
jgi:ketosteroid isomerase-like protein